MTLVTKAVITPNMIPMNKPPKLIVKNDAMPKATCFIIIHIFSKFIYLVYLKRYMNMFEVTNKDDE